MDVREYEVVAIYRSGWGDEHVHVTMVEAETVPDRRVVKMSASEARMRMSAGFPFFTVGPISGRRAGVDVEMCDGCGALMFFSPGCGHTDENVEYLRAIGE